MRYSLIALAFFMASSPSLAQERLWSLDVTDTEAFLVFGVPETDDVGVSLWCKFGNAQIKVFVPETSKNWKADQTANFTLAVGSQSFEVSGKTSANELADSVSIEGEIPANAPFFAALKDQDRFSINAGGHTTTYPLDGADFSALTAMCSAK